MSIQKTDTEDAKIFSKLTSIILATCAVTFLLSLAIGTFCFGHIPVYGVDRDPYSLDLLMLNAIQWINFISLFFSFFAFLAWPLLIIHQLVNKTPFTSIDKLIHLSGLFSIILFFLFKYMWTAQFDWHFD